MESDAIFESNHHLLVRPSSYHYQSSSNAFTPITKIFQRELWWSFNLLGEKLNSFNSTEISVKLCRLGFKMIKNWSKLKNILPAFVQNHWDVLMSCSSNHRVTGYHPLGIFRFSSQELLIPPQRGLNGIKALRFRLLEKSSCRFIRAIRGGEARAIEKTLKTHPSWSEPPVPSEDALSFLTSATALVAPRWSKIWWDWNLSTGQMSWKRRKTNKDWNYGGASLKCLKMFEVFPQLGFGREFGSPKMGCTVLPHFLRRLDC